MAFSKVPYDPNMTPEVRDFLDGLARNPGAFETRISALEDALDAFEVAGAFWTYNSLSQLTLSNGTDATNDINIAAGACADSTNVASLVLTATLTKRLDAAWVVGTNQGGLDTGSIANDTYYIHLIRRSDTGVTDALFSLSASSPTMPANYDQRRRIGAIIRIGATILPFTQDYDNFYLTTPVENYDTTLTEGSRTLVTMTCPPGMHAIFRIVAFDTDLWRIVVQPTIETDAAPATNASPGYSLVGSNTANSGTFTVLTNASSQIAMRADVVGAGTVMDSVAIYTLGWIDRRGK